MHPPHIKVEALALVEAGLNDCEISRRRGRWDVRINRRASVALVLEHVGLKR
jgi:hypothetical protein